MHQSSRTDIGFDESVVRAFSFLVDRFGFMVAVKETTLVRFESPQVFLVVYHGRVSYEIGVEIGLLGDSQERKYLLPEVMGAIQGRTIEQDEFYWQASTSERAAQCVGMAAAVVKENYSGLLRCEKAAWRKLCAATARARQASARESIERPIREAAELAWKEKNYSKVVELYRSIESSLSGVESRRLEFSERTLGGD